MSNIVLPAIFAALLIVPTTLAQIEQQQPQQVGQTTLVVTQNSDGQGIRVIDRNTNRQLINTGDLQNNNQQENDDDDDEMDEQVVNGLLEWLENKKKKKKNKKDKDKEKKPLVLPTKRPKIEKKEIHIHINNHISKDHKHHKGKHQQHHKGKHHSGGHYEDYHDGHYEGHHDKHYQGKHSWPLLGHHYYDLDHYDDHYGGGYSHGGHDHGDEYGGYESKEIAKYAKNPTSNKKAGDTMPKKMTTATRDFRNKA